MNRAISPLHVLHDPPADGPANMQRDLDLLESLADQPILRLYQWSGRWVSYGYFQTEATAAAHFPEPDLQFVKRPTGGGLVDHRHDLTYTLLIPKQHPLAKLSRSDCYFRIHQLVQKALTRDGHLSQLITQEIGEGPSCFQHPVPGDLIEPLSGKKLAGAAQRRTRYGLLHQGSIQIPSLNTNSVQVAFAELTNDLKA